MMDDMTAFERLIANAARQAVGPPRPIDAASVVRAVTAPAGRWSVVTRRLQGGTTRAPTEGGFTMSSAVKFIAAGVIVALFGGFLLAGVLTTPQSEEVLPAAVSASPTAQSEPDEVAEPPDPQPSLMTSEELLSGPDAIPCTLIAHCR